MYDQNCNKTLNGGQSEGHSGAGGMFSPTFPSVKGCPTVPLLPSLRTWGPQVREPGTREAPSSLRINPVLIQSSNSHVPGFVCHWIATEVSQSSTSKDNGSTALTAVVSCKSCLFITGDNARHCQ